MSDATDRPGTTAGLAHDQADFDRYIAAVRSRIDELRQRATAAEARLEEAREQAARPAKLHEKIGAAMASAQLTILAEQREASRLVDAIEAAAAHEVARVLAASRDEVGALRAATAELRLTSVVHAEVLELRSRPGQMSLADRRDIEADPSSMDETMAI